MRYIIVILSFIFVIPLLRAQEQEPAPKPEKIKHFNLIKAGTALQIDFHPHYKYDYYYGDYYYESYNTPGGPKSTTCLGYEHIWEFRNKLALAVEPKAGFAFLERSFYLYAGNDLKFYWGNKGIWRMGVALSTDYYYGQNDIDFVVTKGDGNYQELISTKMKSHNINIDLGIIPFQFHFTGFPIVIETQFSMLGLGLLFEHTEKYKEPDGNTNQYEDFTAYPFVLKPEIRIGFQLP